MRAVLNSVLVSTSTLGLIMAGAGCDEAPTDPIAERSGAIEAPDVSSDSNVSNASQDLNVDFTGCHEFAGIGFVPVTNARRLVPARYTLAGDANNGVIVVRVAQCADTVIGKRHIGPGTLSQIGISLVGPDTTADINNYTLWYTTTSQRLADALHDNGISAEADDDLTFTVDPAGNLSATDTPRRAPAYRLRGTAVAPTAAPVPFTANWWQDRDDKVASMRTTFPQIAFGTAAATLTTAAGSALGRLIGGTTLQFPLLDSYNAFHAAHMVVHQGRIDRD